MSKQEFARRWESNEDGGGITFDDIAECAVEWGLFSRPKTKPTWQVEKAVLHAAGVE